MSKVDGASKGGGGDGDSIQVFVRVRPPGRQEGDLDLGACVSVDTTNNALILKAKPDPKVFTFDQVADIKTTQETVFAAVAKKMIEKCISGYNGTIFAYGQTGSGKTFTMVGPNEDDNTFQHELRGVIPRCFEYLFGLMNRQKELLGDRIQYLCRASFLEIYNEQLSDLLDAGAASPQLRENIKRGVVVEGLTERMVNTASDAYEVLQDGWKNRRVAETAMNHESSRSHAVFTLHIESKENKQGTWQVRASRLNLVDLAGSERQKDTKTTGSRLKEGCSINKSLSALGNVIMSLVQSTHDPKPRYIPYRDSKLTFLLRDSLGGNAKTHIIACIHPGNKFFGETLSTLQFARRAKQIKNKAVVNEDIHGDVPALRAELTRLKEDLAVRDKLLEELKATGVSGPGVPSGAVGSGPWRERFMDAMRLCEGLREKIKEKDQKQESLEKQINQKDKNLMQKKMMLQFRTETIKKLEAQYKEKNPDCGSEDLFLSLREEIRVLEEQLTGRREARDADRGRLQREVATLRQQLDAQDMGEERLLAAYEEAMANKDLRPQLITPKQASGEEATGTVERQKSQIAKLHAEMETVKRCHSVEMETLKKKMMDIEDELASAQAVKAELEKTLEMTQQRCTIQRETQEKIHMETIKTITTPKRIQYQLRNRRVLSEGVSTPDSATLTQEEDGLQEETMPDVMYQEQIEGLTNQITTLRQENSNLAKKIQEYDTKVIDIVKEKSGIQSRNASLEEKNKEYEETAGQHDEVVRNLQREINTVQESARLAVDELQDLRIQAAQYEKHMRETREERDSLKKENTTLESKVLSLGWQLDESVRQKDDITTSLNTAKDDMENIQSELEYLVCQQEEIKTLLQTEKAEHAQTRAYLQTVQTRLDNETSLVEQLKSQMHQQGSEKEQEVVSLMEAKQAVEGDLETRLEEIALLQGRVDALTQQASTTQDQLRQHERAKKDLEAAMLTVSEERNTLRQDLRSVTSEKDDLLNQLSDLSMHHTSDIEKHLAELSVLKEEQQYAEAALKQQLSDKEYAMSCLQVQYEMQQEDIEELTKGTNTLETEKSEAEMEIKRLNDLKVKLSNQITELDSKVVQLEEKLSGQQQMYEARLREQTVEDSLLAQLQAERDDLYRNNIEKDQDLRTALENSMVLNDHIEHLGRQNKDLQKDCMERKAELTKKDEEIQTWQKIAQSEQEETMRLTRRERDLDMIVQQKEIDLANLRVQIKKDKEELDSARDLQSKVEAKTCEVEILQQDIADKEDQITRMRSVAESDQEETSKLTSQVAQLQEVTRQLTDEISELKEKLDKSESEKAKWAGHNNPNQKIHYVQHLKDENRKLTEEKGRLETRVFQLETKLRENKSQNTTNGHQLAKGLPTTPARYADHRPGNGTPGQKRHTEGTPGQKKHAVGTPGQRKHAVGTPGQKPPANDKPLVAKENKVPSES